MGAPGIEAENPVATTVYYVPLWAAEPAPLQGIMGPMFYSVLLSPPTYVPPVRHPYKCLGGQL
jgi:hypothetical protein